MGLFSKKQKEEAGKDYCLFCGMDIVDGVCSRCGREAKPMIDPGELNFRQVPQSVAAELGEQKKKLFGNEKWTVQEMIRSGSMYLADILFDSTVEDSREVGTDDCEETEYDYYVQFSAPDGTPCNTCCGISSSDCYMVEDQMKNGHREGWLLKGILKKKVYYYAFVPQDVSLGKMLRAGGALSFIGYGTDYEKRRPAPKGVRDTYEFRRVISCPWDDAKQGDS